MATRAWTGGAFPDIKASTAGNWDTGAPGVGDVADFPLFSSGAVDWDITDALSDINLSSGSSCTVTQSVKVTTGTITFDSGGGASWDMNGFDLEITGSTATIAGTPLTPGLGAIIFTGFGTQNFVASSETLYDVRVDKTGGTLNFNSTFNISNLLEVITDGPAYTITFDNGGTSTINEIQTKGTSGNETNIRSDSAGLTTQLNVTVFTFHNQYSAWRDVVINGGTLSVSRATGTDQGNNTNIAFGRATGSFTVGTGGDYDLWKDAVDDIADVLTGNLTLTQISDVTEPVAFTRSGSQAVDLDGNTLLLDSDTPHAGIIDAGHRILTQHDFSSTLYCESTSVGGILEVRNLQWKHDAGMGQRCFWVGIEPGGTNTHVKVHDCIFNGNGIVNAYELLLNGVNNNIIDLYNIVHVDANTTTTSYGCIRFDCNGDNDCRAWNITVRNTGTGRGFWIADMYQQTGVNRISNVVVSMPNSTQNFYYQGLDSGFIKSRFMHYCASEDSSANGGNNAIDNFVEADEFRSVVSGNANYVVPDAGSQFEEGGEAVDTSADIRGLAFGSFPPIGAYISAPNGGGGGGGAKKRTKLGLQLGLRHI